MYKELGTQTTLCLLVATHIGVTGMFQLLLLGKVSPFVVNLPVWKPFIMEASHSIKGNVYTTRQHCQGSQQGLGRYTAIALTKPLK